MFKTYWFRALVGVTFITVAGGIYLTFGNKAQTFSGNQNNTVLASVWDKPSESYSGNKDITVYRSPSCGCCGLWIEHQGKLI